GAAPTPTHPVVGHRRGGGLTELNGAEPLELGQIGSRPAGVSPPPGPAPGVGFLGGPPGRGPEGGGLSLPPRGGRAPPAWPPAPRGPRAPDPHPFRNSPATAQEVAQLLEPPHRRPAVAQTRRQSRHPPAHL